MQTNPTVLIIFGVTGDLMSKKIAGSLFHLFKKGKLPKNFQIIGFARRDIPLLEFQKYIQNITLESVHIPATIKEVEKFAKLFSYVQGNFNDKASYKVLGDKVNNRGKIVNKLYYLAVPPTLYENIFENLSEAKIAVAQKKSWTRIIVEKPFGNNLETAEKLDLLLGKLFKEDQIYRIDHYLGKDILQNILAFRFSNNLLEHSWNNSLIEKIEIKLFEKEGVDKRADTYDGIGALRDVGQNHVMQMLSLVAMDNPITFNASRVRQKRSEVLQQIKKLTPNEIKSKTIRSQYKNYKLHDGVNKNSSTETYFKITTEINSKRWRGVPFILESGKKMKEQRKEIIVTFRHTTPCSCPPEGHYKNKVIFTLEPKEEIKIIFWAKKPGLEMKLEERNFDFGYRQLTNEDFAADYEKLFLDCITGDQMLFVSTEEVRAMWKFIDPIIKAWEKNMVPLNYY